MTLAYISLGSNLDHPREQVKTALASICCIPDTRIIMESSVLETQPIGPQDQPNFINQVIVVKTALLPHELLYALQAIENTMGRVRTQHWGPRIIDLDILLFGDETIKTDELVVPHPEIAHRPFILSLLEECYEKNRDLSRNV